MASLCNLGFRNGMQLGKVESSTKGREMSSRPDVVNRDGSGES